MNRLRHWLALLWEYVREISGEAALERRMRQHACSIDHALEDLGDRPRCC